MSFVSLFIPAKIHAKAGLRTKRRMPFILGVNLLGLINVIGYILYILITSGLTYYAAALSGLAMLFILSIILLRSGKFAIGAYLCSIVLFFSCTITVFSLPMLSILQILYRLTIVYLLVGTLNLIIGIRRRQIIGFFAGAASTMIIFFLFEISASNSTHLRVLLICLACIAGNTVIHLMINALNEGIYRISNAHTIEARESLERMKDLVENVKDSVAFSVTLGDAADRLDAAVTGMQEVYQYLQSQSDSWEQISDGLKQSFDIILAKMHDMTGMIGKQNTSINQSSSVLSDISQNITNINTIASERRDSMYLFMKRSEEQNTQMEELINTVELLRSSSQGIMSFANTVENIASQTGVLAMNASIEAAHAGQLGKGFGVIAQEIRKLSGETTKTARKISEMLGDNNKIVQNAAHSFALFAEETKKQINESYVIIKSIESIIAAVTEMGQGTNSAMQTAAFMVETATEANNRIQMVSNEIAEQRISITEFAGFLDSINTQIQSFMDGINHIKAASSLVAETGLKNRKIVGSINSSLRKVYGPVHIPWNDSYKVGIDTIDAQHQHLFEIADTLYFVLKSETPPTRTAVEALLNDCAEYVKLHFSHEEELMDKSKYPETLSHQNAHHTFTTSVSQVITDFSNGKEINLKELYAFLSDWLVEHIIRVDRSLGTYLNKCSYCKNAGQCKNTKD